MVTISSGSLSSIVDFIWWGFIAEFRRMSDEIQRTFQDFYRSSQATAASGEIR
jgi:hypothetical protein